MPSYSDETDLKRSMHGHLVSNVLHFDLLASLLYSGTKVC